MINKNKKIGIVFLLLGIILMGFFTACKKDFFDVNKNPNHPADVTVDYLLPSAEAAIAHAVGNNLQIYGGFWAQFWTQSPTSSQYKSLDQYNPASTDFDSPWKILYADALQDLQTIIAKGTATNQMQYVACAKILEAYTYQLLTDNWGDVPFSEALQAQSGNIAPHFDSQKDIYTNIIKMVGDGIALIDSANSGGPGMPAADDILFQGHMDNWKHFANTLKLRMYLRLSEIDPVTGKNGVMALQSSGAVFLQSGEDAKIVYTSNGGNTNPIYSSLISLNNVQNFVASSTAVDYMNNNNDNRQYYLYTPLSNGAVVGLIQGGYNFPYSTPSTTVCYPGAAVGGDNRDPNSATAPVKLMSSYESFFLQAEAVARGWMVGDDSALYIAGITENYMAYVTPVDSVVSWATAYYSQPAIAYPTTGTLQDKVKAIITQKWASMCGNQNDEAWIESRRTNYPDFFIKSKNSIIGDSTHMPERLFYPSAEVSNNGNFPGQKLITAKVWWDAN